MVTPPASSPSPDEAMQFALICQAGMPARDAIRYFAPDLPDDEVERLTTSWMRSSTVQRAHKQLMGKSWQEMSMEERIKFAIDKHYSEHAYFLYRYNYCELQGPDKQKADTCRQVLEAKMAGMSGRMDPLNTFFADVTSGKIKLPGVAAIRAH